MPKCNPQKDAFPLGDANPPTNGFRVVHTLNGILIGSVILQGSAHARDQ